jgi:hypothetical protein
MRRRYLVIASAIAAAVLFISLPATLAGQAQKAKAWTLGRTADGQPDLQGVWGNNVATPLQRPKSLEGKTTLSDEEVAALKTAAAELFDGGGDAAFGDSVFEAAFAKAKTFVSRDGKTGDYNHFWLVDRDFDRRTSLITDPPNGRIPPLTPEGEAKAAERRRNGPRGAEGVIDAGRADTWEDRGLGERCITFGAPRIGAGYNSYVQIFQSRDYVAIGMETIHDARIVPLDGRSHVPSNVRQWHGDSRGRWDGNTLVVDTTNYSSKAGLMNATDKLHVIERFTRVGPTTLNYEITFDDPATWTKPWTLMIPLKHTDEAIYEYACHEGNSGLEGILAGARAEEKRASERATGKSSK